MTQILSQSENSNNHVLVVDDYRVNRIKLSGLLKQLGYKVSLAENGLKAIELINQTKIDVILLDIIMPEMDGYKCLTYL
ncbi:MAG: response regulator, partial [Desulfamplus sp.]|nr:response regulator [Desulfamplus sp.]